MKNIEAKKFLTDNLQSKGFEDISAYLKDIQYGDKTQCYVYCVRAKRNVGSSGTQYIDHEMHVWHDANGWSMAES